MDLLLDTCIILRNDDGQSKVPNFNYTQLDILLKDKSNSLYITPFSLPEIFIRRTYKNINELLNYLSSENIKILNYGLFNDSRFNVYDNILDRSFAVMYHHLTEFLHFFIINVTQPLVLDDINVFEGIVGNTIEKYYFNNEKINFNNCTKFMKNDCVLLIVKCIKKILSKYGQHYDEMKIWQIIGDTIIGDNLIYREIHPMYLRYARYLVSLFRQKYNNSATKIKLSFGFIDLLILYSHCFNFTVISSDKKINEYLLKYGNLENINVVNSLWNVKLQSADY